MRTIKKWTREKILELIRQLADDPPNYCGADRDRTCDPRVANAMLSQLSYSPVGLDRLELPTPALSERCSNRLSYKPQNMRMCT